MEGGKYMKELVLGFAKAEPKKFIALIVLMFSCIVLHMFSVWQLDLICCPAVWSYKDDMLSWYFSNLERYGADRYADVYFQCWLWRTTIGEAYDMLFFLNFLSFYGVLIVSCCFMYYLLKYRKVFKSAEKKG